MGARAGIGGTYAVMPELFLQLNQFIEDREIDLAKELQYVINDIIALMVSCYGIMYSVAKEILRINEEMDIGSVRAPLTPFIESDFESIRRAASLIQLTKEKFIK